MGNAEKENHCDPAAVPGSNAEGSVAGSSRGGRKVLRVWVVDDYAELRELFSQFLNSQPGFKCNRQFSSVESLLKTLAEERGPDLILLDVNLTGMSGLAGIPKILAIAPEVKVVMMTTFSNVHYERDAFTAGAAGFLLKSYDLEQFVEVLSEAYKRPHSTDLFPNLNTRSGEKFVLEAAKAAEVERSRFGMINAFRQLWGNRIRKSAS